MYNYFMRYEAILDSNQKISCDTQINPNAYLHFHRSIEIHYVVQGKIFVSCERTEYTVKSGEIMFIPSHYHHAVETIEKDSIDEVLIIPSNYLEDIAKLNVSLDYYLLDNLKINCEIYKYILLIKTELNEQPSIFIQGLVNIILGLVVKNYKPKKHTPPPHDNIIEQIISYIEKHYRDDISLDSLSQYFCYDKYYFSKLFNKNFRCTLPDFVNSVRVEHILNDNSKRSITSKILDAGFREVSTFYKYKKKHYRFT